MLACGRAKIEQKKKKKASRHALSSSGICTAPGLMRTKTRMLPVMSWKEEKKKKKESKQTHETLSGGPRRRRRSKAHTSMSTKSTSNGLASPVLYRQEGKGMKTRAQAQHKHKHKTHTHLVRVLELLHPPGLHRLGLELVLDVLQVLLHLRRACNERDGEGEGTQRTREGTFM